MNCTIVRGRFHDEVICTPPNILGVETYPSTILSIVVVVLVLIMIRVDKVLVYCAKMVRRIRCRTSYEMSPLVAAEP